MTDKVTYEEIVLLAEAHGGDTDYSITNAQAAYLEQTGVGLAELEYTLEHVGPVPSILDNPRQRLYRSPAEVGQYQLDGERSQSVADEMIEWFEGMSQAYRDDPDSLFPGIMVTRDGVLELVDGCHRTAARFWAGDTKAPMYHAQA